MGRGMLVEGKAVAAAKAGWTVDATTAGSSRRLCLGALEPVTRVGSESGRTRRRKTTLLPCTTSGAPK